MIEISLIISLLALMFVGGLLSYLCGLLIGVERGKQLCKNQRPPETRNT